MDDLAPSPLSRKRARVSEDAPSDVLEPALPSLPSPLKCAEAPALAEIITRMKCGNVAEVAAAMLDLRQLILKRGRRVQLAVCASECLSLVVRNVFFEGPAPECHVVVEAACRVLCTMYV